MSSVYISCSLDSSSHISEIRELISLLTEKGIVAEVDTGDPFQPEEWHQQRLEESDAILAICSSMYYSVIMQNASPGKGMQWNGDMIRRAMFSRDEIADKSIPILLSNGTKAHVLTILKDKEILTFPDDQDRLLEILGISSPETETDTSEPKSALDLLRKGEIAAALDLLKQDPDHQNTDELILFQSRFARLTKEIEHGVLSSEDRILFTNKLVYDLLRYLEDETN